jgi:3-keto-5-aminohexanoate cleavage enzyme
MEPLIINAAITGMVPMPADNPSLPVTVEQIVAEARRCANAGASILHIHAREEDGTPTWRAEIYQEIIRGIRSNCPGLLISASTSGRLWPEFEKRSAVLDCRPDLGSLTPGSMNFPSQPSVNSPQTIRDLAEAMKKRGIVPELEFFEIGMIDFVRDHLAAKGIIQPPIYANLLLGSLGTMSASARNLVHMVDALPAGTVWAAAGIGRFQLPINNLAIAMGGHVRTGLEDNLWMNPAKTDPASNVRLIERVVRVAEAMGRPIAGADTARKMIGLPQSHGPSEHKDRRNHAPASGTRRSAPRL